jgi:outer membrane protein assembly factor BamB
LLILPIPFLAGAVPAARPDARPPAFAADDWPWWRGPTRNGIAPAGPRPPLKWGEGENVLWKAPVPGRGHGSPTVVGGHVYLATAETEPPTQSVLCFDRKTGKRLWQTVVHRGGLPTKGNGRASLASSTVACDGDRLFVNFLNGGAVHTTALDRTGKQLWQTKVADYVIHQGYGSSPAVYGPLVIVAADNKGGKGALAGLDRRTGKVVWKRPRPKTPNYASPIVLRVAGRDQLVMTGCNLVSGLDPLTGKTLWEVKGATTECVTSTVTDGQRVFTSGGYPKNHVSAVRADGSGTLEWENGSRVYVPSLLAHQGCLYGVLDAGVAACWKCDTGKELWRKRLKGSFSASPVLVGDTLFATNEAGRTFLFKARPDGYTAVGENQLGREAFASPVVCGGCVFLRVAAATGGKRQETLYCVGAKSER